MKRIKRHKVKTEAPETSTFYNREQEVHDLAYYIHDRVELMHQVFSVIRYKELKAMVPASIRNISLDDLQELCTEELLGISSKRLCAILDGADPPSDTESSSPSPPPEQMETISLDSISSDDEILSQTSNKRKKHKHRRRSSKSKSKRKKSKDEDDEEADRNKASRAGLTVLELLELQARARAIRAQLQQEQQHKPILETASKEAPHSSDNEVEIKEEPAEVVEISSDEEKPKVEELQKKITAQKEPDSPQQAATVTKRINDLVITVPQKTKQKIKLNRTKSTTASTEKVNSVAITENTNNNNKSVATIENVEKSTEKRVENDMVTKKDKPKKKKKDKKSVRKDDIDNDEITLQLSDTEKMDLLEDLDRKHYDCVSSESSSESSSDSDVPEKDKDSSLKEENITPENSKDCEETVEKNTVKPDEVKSCSDKKDSDDKESRKNVEKVAAEHATEDSSKKSDLKSCDNDNTGEEDKMESDNNIQKSIENNVETQVETVEETDSSKKDSDTSSKDKEEKASDDTVQEIPTVATKDNKNENNEPQAKSSEKDLSEGELSDRESSEIEAVDLKPEVVCISDEEGKKKAKKKKKKKEKKSKKSKTKTKKKSDFRESADQNFYKDTVEVIKDKSILSDLPISGNVNNPPSAEIIDNVDLTATKTTIDTKPIKEEESEDIDNSLPRTVSPAPSDDDIDAVYEIMELSDDSSCCEVECTILSKEPTTSEIEALSAKIDEIERVEVITDKEIREYERMEREKADVDDVQNISWKDRYLDSTKVKKVLNTANILNTLRKKNIDLKKKLAESKKVTEESVAKEKDVEKDHNVLKEGSIDHCSLEEGSIEHYNTLEALTKYVDPVKEVPKDLKKDAKLLLKMYKKLLKYNDMNRPEDVNKKRKKKKKKLKKDKKNNEEDCVANVECKDVIKDLNEERNNLVCSAEQVDAAVEININIENKEESVDLAEDSEVGKLVHTEDC